jgi:serine/threonine-protein kinase
MSQTWFEKAAESESLDKDKKELSKRFASIAAYYASLDSVDESGYSTTSYGDYWIDLVSLTDGDLTSVVNPETALVMYKELVYRIPNVSRPLLIALICTA